MKNQPIAVLNLPGEMAIPEAIVGWERPRSSRYWGNVGWVGRERVLAKEIGVCTTSHIPPLASVGVKIDGTRGGVGAYRWQTRCSMNPLRASSEKDLMFFSLTISAWLVIGISDGDALTLFS